MEQNKNENLKLEDHHNISSIDETESSSNKQNEKNLSQDKQIYGEEEAKEVDELTLLMNEVNLLKDTLLRKVAEFENYKRRTEGEISNYIKFASEDIIKELIPVYDDLSRSIESLEKGETKDFDTLKKGIVAIYNKFKNVLEKEDVKEIDCLGKEFNVDQCEALLQIPKEDVKPNTVIEIVEKGYSLKDKVIRHAKVLVSKDN